ncbi:hypothetical protein GQ457_12G031970 [Hibiscus cannabinus]
MRPATLRIKEHPVVHSSRNLNNSVMIKLLTLRSSCHDCGEHGVIQKYDTPEEEVRLILDVVKGDIILNNRKRADLFLELKEKGGPKKAKDDSDDDDNFDIPDLRERLAKHNIDSSPDHSADMETEISESIGGINISDEDAEVAAPAKNGGRKPAANSKAGKPPAAARKRAPAAAGKQQQKLLTQMLKPTSASVSSMPEIDTDEEDEVALVVEQRSRPQRFRNLSFSLFFIHPQEFRHPCVIFIFQGVFLQFSTNNLNFASAINGNPGSPSRTKASPLNLIKNLSLSLFFQEFRDPALFSFSSEQAMWQAHRGRVSCKRDFPPFCGRHAPPLKRHSVKKSKEREGLCVHDISQGKEKIPICAINNIDAEKPLPFEYVAHMIHPNWCCPIPCIGCDCLDGCSQSNKCACVTKNGGDLPYNHDGAIVEIKPLVYECGPACKCPSSCYNRVGQHGIKFQFEIFRTESKGWGVRSLNFIPSGSFICEYVGEVLEDSEAEKRTGNDDYLFDIGNSYGDSSPQGVSESFTIDAARETVANPFFLQHLEKVGNPSWFLLENSLFTNAMGLIPLFSRGVNPFDAFFLVKRWGISSTK